MSETIKATIATWQADPGKAKGTPTVKADSQGSRAVMESGPFRLEADLAPALGGSNEAPSPTMLLLGALAGCAVVFIKDTLGPQLGIPVERVEAVATCETDARGLLGLSEAAPDLSNINLSVTIHSEQGDAAVEQLSQVWTERCPIYLALQKPMDVKVNWAAGN